MPKKMKISVAVIECYERIACNPCESACPAGAIYIGDDINNIPELRTDLCTGCGRCISSCPGQAIFVIEEDTSSEYGFISIPYEFLPLPAPGDTGSGLNREGHYVCDVEVVKIRCTASSDRTPVITLKVPPGKVMDIRHFTPGKSIDLKTGDLRIANHPILGKERRDEMIELCVDDRKVRAYPNESIAAAITAAGIRNFRTTSKKHEERGLFCSIGVCTDCMMTVNGLPNVRTCITPVKEGMIITRQGGESNG